MDLILGIDEAGRGAVLGPLIVAGVIVEAGKEERLWPLGARDSKALSRPRRKTLLRDLWREEVRGRVTVIPPKAIDHGNLTFLELQAMAEIVRKLRPTLVVLDPPVGPQAIPRFVHRFCQEAGIHPSSIRAFPKADAKNPVVATASILAKVVRDGYVGVLHKEFGDFGWGYPGERKVQEFLRGWLATHGEFPSICRKRWRSVQGLRALKLQDGL
ncbi:MAG: ribonuclease HII [Candidatus Bipolaricaulota bacterium]|nr:ribonuclease HII [Candidatus Bipolaricaulota bacterium]MDW8127032.1 ribonuclease HII [Candidatus Bipolaricaulota bacterium]